MKSIETLLQQEISRAEFLKIVGIAAVSVFGISGMIATLSQRTAIIKRSASGQQVATRGFGTRKFGE